MSASYVWRRTPSCRRGTPGSSPEGRVCQGNPAGGTNLGDAIFRELSSNPATMAGATAIGPMPLFRGVGGEPPDATHAYTRAGLKGVPTYVRLPTHASPKSLGPHGGRVAPQARCAWPPHCGWATGRSAVRLRGPNLVLGVSRVEVVDSPLQVAAGPLGIC